MSKLSTCSCGECERCVKTRLQKERRKQAEILARKHNIHVVSGESIKMVRLRIARAEEEKKQKLREASIDDFHAWP